MKVVALEIATMVIFCVVGALSLVLGANRGNHIRRINTHVAFFYVWYMALWYFVKAWAPLTVEVHRDDGTVHVDLARLLASATVMVLLVVLSTYTLKQEALDMLLHFLVCVSVHFFVYLALSQHSSTHRSVWAGVAIVTSALLFVHVSHEIAQIQYHHTRFSAAIVGWTAVYMAVYLASTLWSPFFEDLISVEVYHVINNIADILITLFCLPNVVHYSWGIPSIPESPMQPNDFGILYRRSTFYQQRDLIKQAHLFHHSK